MNTYLYSLSVSAVDEDGDPIEEIAHIEGYSEESLLEQLRKIDGSIKDYETEQEAKAQEDHLRYEEDMAYQRSKEELPF